MAEQPYRDDACVCPPTSAMDCLHDQCPSCRNVDQAEEPPPCANEDELEEGWD